MRRKAEPIPREVRRASKGICLLGIVVATLHLLLSLSSRWPSVGDLEFWFGVLFLIWPSIPFFLLSLAVRYIHRTALIWTLAIIGFVAEILFLNTIQSHSTHSTQAVALVFLPCYLLGFYGLVGAVVWMVTGIRSKAKERS